MPDGGEFAAVVAAAIVARFALCHWLAASGFGVVCGGEPLPPGAGEQPLTEGPNRPNDAPTTR